jgi:hypothetical protein
MNVETLNQRWRNHSSLLLYNERKYPESELNISLHGESRQKVLLWVSVLLLLTLNLLTSTIVAPPSNARKWQMGFNLAFKGLNTVVTTSDVAQNLGMTGWVRCTQHYCILLGDWYTEQLQVVYGRIVKCLVQGVICNMWVDKVLPKMRGGLSTVCIFFQSCVSTCPVVQVVMFAIICIYFHTPSPGAGSSWNCNNWVWSRRIRFLLLQQFLEHSGFIL